MNSNYEVEAVSVAEVAPGSVVARTPAVRWSRALPLMLLVPIVFAFGTPVFAFALLAAVLAAPALVATAVVLAARE